jgi:hypothetical protein
MFLASICLLSGTLEAVSNLGYRVAYSPNSSKKILSYTVLKVAKKSIFLKSLTFYETNLTL